MVTLDHMLQLVQTQRGVVLHTTNQVYQITQILVTHKENMCTHNSVGVSRWTHSSLVGLCANKEHVQQELSGALLYRLLFVLSNFIQYK